MDENVERLIKAAFGNVGLPGAGELGKSMGQVVLATGLAIATWEAARKKGLPRDLCTAMAVRVLEFLLFGGVEDGDVGAP